MSWRNNLSKSQCINCPKHNLRHIYLLPQWQSRLTTLSPTALKLTSLKVIINTLALAFLYFKRKHYMSPEEMCVEGNGFVSSMGSFKYFLGKGWAVLIYCDPSPHTWSVGSVSFALMSDFFFFFCKMQDGCRWSDSNFRRL